MLITSISKEIAIWVHSGPEKAIDFVAASSDYVSRLGVKASVPRLGRDSREIAVVGKASTFFTAQLFALC